MITPRSSYFSIIISGGCKIGMPLSSMFLFFNFRNTLIVFLHFDSVQNPFWGRIKMLKFAVLANTKTLWTEKNDTILDWDELNRNLWKCVVIIFEFQIELRKCLHTSRQTIQWMGNVTFLTIWATFAEGAVYGKCLWGHWRWWQS